MSITDLSHVSLANSASYLSTMLKTDGAPNDVMNNFNSLSIIIFSPILNVRYLAEARCVK
jgi:dipeptide/tripeptide permease